MHIVGGVRRSCTTSVTQSKKLWCEGVGQMQQQPDYTFTPGGTELYVAAVVAILAIAACAGRGGSPPPRVPSKWAMRRVAQICRRRYGISVIRLYTSLRSLFKSIVWVSSFVELPRFLFPSAVLSKILRADFSECPYIYEPLAGPRASVREAPWKPLRNVGHCVVSTEEVNSAFDRCRPRPRNEESIIHPRPCAATDFIQDYIADMLRHDLVRENVQHPYLPRKLKLPSWETLKVRLLQGITYFTTVDVENFYISLRFAGDHPPFCIHVEYPDNVRAFEILHCPFGFDASPFIGQSKTCAAVLPAVQRTDAQALVYLDDTLVFAGTTSAAEEGGTAAADALKADHLPPHPVKTNLRPQTSADWLGKHISSVPPEICPIGEAALDCIASSVLALSLPMCLRDRQRLTGALTWAGLQHMLHLPFLTDVHAWLPVRKRLPPPSVRSAALRSAVIASLPWTGQGFLPTPLEGAIHAFFDGTKGLATAVFLPPATGIVLPLPRDTSQQHAEMVAAELCVETAATFRIQNVIVAGDSAATLGSLRKLSTSACYPHRAGCLQRIAVQLLQYGTCFSLAKVPGAGPARNPADPLARIQVPEACVLGISHPAVQEAQSLWRNCNPELWYSSFGNPPLPPSASSLRAGASSATAATYAPAAATYAPAAATYAPAAATYAPAAATYAP
eukprot:gene21991-biopygen8706